MGVLAPVLLHGTAPLAARPMTATCHRVLPAIRTAVAVALKHVLARRVPLVATPRPAALLLLLLLLAVLRQVMVEQAVRVASVVAAVVAEAVSAVVAVSAEVAAVADNAILYTSLYYIAL